LRFVGLSLQQCVKVAATHFGFTTNRSVPTKPARGEVAKTGPHVIDRWLRSMQQQKTVRSTGAQYHLPIFPALSEILDATPTPHLTFMTTKSHRPLLAERFLGTIPGMVR
jgi:hypothetical protein